MNKKFKHAIEWLPLMLKQMNEAHTYDIKVTKEAWREIMNLKENFHAEVVDLKKNSQAQVS